MRKALFDKKVMRIPVLLCALILCSVAVLTGCVASGGNRNTVQSNADVNTANEKQAAEVTKVTLDKQTAGLYVGKTMQLSAKVTPADAEDTSLSWSSSDETIALVNSEGYVTGVAAGYVNIVCRASNGVEASCTVTVKEENGAKKEEKDDKSDTGNNGGGSNTTIVYYGHYHPDYVYNASDFVFPDSSVRKLSRSEISATLSSMGGASVSGSFAQDAINEIYARNGYVFNTPNIRAYYESKPWYYPDPNFTTGDFNDVEKYNIGLLTDYQ